MCVWSSVSSSGDIWPNWDLGMVMGLDRAIHSTKIVQLSHMLVEEFQSVADKG
jgi:hypothetical protein